MNWEADDQLIHSSDDEGRADSELVALGPGSDPVAPEDGHPTEGRPHEEFATLYNDPGVPDAPTSFDEPVNYVEPPVDAPSEELAMFEPETDGSAMADSESDDESEASRASDPWATPADWSLAWDDDDEDPDEPAATPFSTEPSAQAPSEGRTSLFSAGPSQPPAASSLPTIGADLDTEMPYSASAPMPPAEPVVRPDPAFTAPPAAAGRRFSVLHVVLGLLLAGAVAFTVVTWLSGEDEPEFSEIPGTLAPTIAPTTAVPTTVLDAAAATFTSTPLADGWVQVASVDGGVSLELPSTPKVRAAAGTGGLVSLSADLPGGGMTELIWSPIQPGLPNEVTSFMAMTTARERYPTLSLGATSELGGLRYADGTGTTGTDQLRARVTMTDKFAFVVLTSVPATADQAAAGAEWFRILGSLEITG